MHSFLLHRAARNPPSRFTSRNSTSEVNGLLEGCYLPSCKSSWTMLVVEMGSWTMNWPEEVNVEGPTSEWCEGIGLRGPGHGREYTEELLELVEMEFGNRSPTLRRLPVSCSLLVALSPSLLVLYSTDQQIVFRRPTTSPMVGRMRHSGSMHSFARSATCSKSPGGNLPSRSGSASPRRRALSVSSGRACQWRNRNVSPHNSEKTHVVYNLSSRNGRKREWKVWLTHAVMFSKSSLA